MTWRPCLWLTPLLLSTACANETVVVPPLEVSCDEHSQRAQGSEFDATEARQLDERLTQALAEQRFFAMQSALPLDLPHVLEFGMADQSLIAHACGQRAQELQLKSSVLSLVYSDEVGRRVELQACLNPEELEGSVPRFEGELRRCSSSNCADTKAEAIALHSEHHAPEDRASDLRLEATFRSDEWSAGAIADLAVRDAVVFLARATEGLSIIDTHSDEPRELSRLAPLADDDLWNDVKLYATDSALFALVASRQDGLVIVNVTNPEQPELVVDRFPKTVGGRGAISAHNIFVEGKMAYVARSGKAGGLLLIDLQNPRVPELRIIYGFENCEQVHDLFVKEEVVYLNCLDQGLKVFDASEQEEPMVLAEVSQPGSHSTWLTEVGEQTLLLSSAETLAGRLKIFEVAEQSGELHLEELAEFSTHYGASPHNIHCRASDCWLAYYQEGLLWLDLSDPADPKLVAQHQSWNGPGADFFEGAFGVVAEGDKLYVSDTQLGLQVFNGSR